MTAKSEAQRAVLDFAAYLAQHDELQSEHFVDIAEAYIKTMPKRRVDSSLNEALNSGDGTYKP